MRRFVIRKIKDGRVKIFGKYFYPDDRFMKYDGRLDGMRYAFGLYWTRTKSGWIIDGINLWGTEEVYKAAPYKQNYEELTAIPGPECVDGKYNWAFWSEYPIYSEGIEARKTRRLESVK